MRGTGGSVRFYWIEEGRLAGGSCPSPEDLIRLGGEGFDAVISLLDDPRQSAYAPSEAAERLAWYAVPLRDHATPRLGQLVSFYDVLWSLPKDARVLVHCYAGIGRTGIVAASYLVWRSDSVDDALDRVDAWTDGLFRREVRGREGEVRDLLDRFRAVVPTTAPARSPPGSGPPLPGRLRAGPGDGPDLPAPGRGR